MSVICVKVFHKHPDGPKVIGQYHMDRSLLDTINQDYQDWVNTGGDVPSKVYDCYNGTLEEARRQPTAMMIIFSELAHIG